MSDLVKRVLRTRIEYVKKFAIASAAVLAIAGAASAEFIVEPDSLTINIQGEVDEICGLTATGATVDVDFGVLSDTTGEIREDVPFGIVCNSAEGATLGISSQNGGKLLRDGTETGAGNEIAYRVNPDPGGDAFSMANGTPPTSLANDKSYVINADNRLREGRAFDIAVFFNGVKGPDFQGAPTTTVFAGDYSDTITVSLTAN